MSIVPSLLQAIVHVDGEAMVMHAGDKPYVVSPTGQVDLASRGLTLDAVNGIVAQLLPSEFQHALDEFGAVQYELPASQQFSGEHFTVVAARGGDDVWVEIRRRRVPVDDRVPKEMFAAQSAPAVAVAAASAAPNEVTRAQAIVRNEGLAVPDPVQLRPDSSTRLPESEAVEQEIDLDEMIVASGSTAIKQPSIEQPRLAQSPIEEPIKQPRLEPAAIEKKPTAVDVPVSEFLETRPSPMPAGAAPPSPVAATPPPARMPVEVETLAPPAPVAPPKIVAVETAPRQAAPPPPPPKPAPEPVVAAAAPEPVVPAIVPATARAAQTVPLLDVAAELSRESFAEVTKAPLQPADAAVSPQSFVEPVRPPRVVAVSEPSPSPAVSAVPPPITAPRVAFRPTPPPAAPPHPVAAEWKPLAAGPVTPPEPRPAAAELRSIVAESRSVATDEPQPVTEPAHVVSRPSVAAASLGDDVAPPSAVETSAPPSQSRPASPRPAPAQPAVVLPISRSAIRAETPPPVAVDSTVSGLDRLLRLAAARGASALYLSSDTRPSVRVHGEIQPLESEPELTARDVESLLLTLMPERSHEALRTGAATEWICDIDDVGRVRCMSFRDHLGPGGVFRLMPTRSVSVEQLALPRSIQALAIEPEGLVLVAGPRSSGKRTLMAAYMDLINKTRRDHVITIEREINIVHERGSSFISQREIRGNDDDMLAAARAALREDPDVLVIEELRTGGLMNVALEAAASGHLVIGGFSAHTATATIDRIIDLYAPEYRHQVQFALADALRGVIVQVLLRKIGGGRIAAREVLLNTPAVSSVLAEGKTSQLPMAIEGGRRYGMMPMNDSLVTLVQSGAVDSREAYRHASDRPGFLALLKRQGLDTSFAERLA